MLFLYSVSLSQSLDESSLPIKLSLSVSSVESSEETILYDWQVSTNKGIHKGLIHLQLLCIGLTLLHVYVFEFFLNSLSCFSRCCFLMYHKLS